ncbi:MAG: DUF998 domain-containing protein [Coprothermobacterota bacterium]|nr:DUF998 domain-containing protein [Coprothermobacterota bacterium]
MPRISMPPILPIRHGKGKRYNEAMDAQLSGRNGGARLAVPLRKPQRACLLRCLTLAGLLGPALFILVFLVAGWLRPGYDPLRQTVSKLALGPGGWLQTADFMLLALTQAAFALAAWFQLGKGWLSRLGIIALALVALGFFLLIFFPAESGTLRGQVHQRLTEAVALIYMAGASLLAYRLFRLPDWRRMAWPTLFVALLTLTLALGWKYFPEEWLRSWRGLYERVLIVIPLLWQMTLAGWMLKIGRQSITGS